VARGEKHRTRPREPGAVRHHREQGLLRALDVHQCCRGGEPVHDPECFDHGHTAFQRDRFHRHGRQHHQSSRLDESFKRQHQWRNDPFQDDWISDGSDRRDDRTGFIRNIGITLVLGITFLIGQVYDYLTLGFGISDGTFGTTFYTLTGFHGAHVFGGAIMLSVVLYRGLAGQFSSKHHDAVEATSLYWHFVDVVWIALFSTLYFL